MPDRLGGGVGSFAGPVGTLGGAQAGAILGGVAGFGGGAIAGNILCSSGSEGGGGGKNTKAQDQPPADPPVSDILKGKREA